MIRKKNCHRKVLYIHYQVFNVKHTSCRKRMSVHREISDENYLVKIGSSHSFLLSPNTSCMLLYRPRWNPFLSGPPIRNIGVRKASVMTYRESQINCKLRLFCMHNDIYLMWFDSMPQDIYDNRIN